MVSSRGPRRRIKMEAPVRAQQSPLLAPSRIKATVQHMSLCNCGLKRPARCMGFGTEETPTPFQISKKRPDALDKHTHTHKRGTPKPPLGPPRSGVANARAGRSMWGAICLREKGCIDVEMFAPRQKHTRETPETSGIAPCLVAVQHRLGGYTRGTHNSLAFGRAHLLNEYIGNHWRQQPRSEATPWATEHEARLKNGLEPVDQESRHRRDRHRRRGRGRPASLAATVRPPAPRAALTTGRGRRLSRGADGVPPRCSGAPLVRIQGVCSSCATSANGLCARGTSISCIAWGGDNATHAVARRLGRRQRHPRASSFFEPLLPEVVQGASSRHHGRRRPWRAECGPSLRYHWECGDSPSEANRIEARGVRNTCSTFSRVRLSPDVPLKTGGWHMQPRAAM